MKSLSKKIWMVIFLIVLFLSAYPIFTPDSVQYFSYIDFFYGKPLAEWDPDRGWVYPALLWIGTVLSNNILGIMIVLFACYLLFTMYVYRMIALFSTVKHTWILYILIGLFICLNPIIYAMSHAILTEFIASILMLVQLYYSTQHFMNRGGSEKREISYTIVVSILIILEYFTKQMFFPISVAIVVIFEILYCIKVPKIRNFICSISICCTMVISLILSVGYWGSVTNKEKQADTFATILGGVRYFVVEDYEHRDGNTRVSEYYEGTKNVSIMGDNDEVLDTFVYDFKGTVMSSLGFLKECSKHDIKRFMQGYIDNYFILTGIYTRPAHDGILAYQTGRVDKDNIFENLFPSTLPGTNNVISQELRNYFVPLIGSGVDTEWLMESWKSNNWGFWNDYAERFKETGGSLAGRVICTDSSMDIAMLIWIMVIGCAPILAIYYFVRYCKEKEVISVYYAFQTVINVFIFSQMLFFSFTGFIVDRYMFVGYVAGILSMLIMVTKNSDKLDVDYIKGMMRR